MERQSDNRISYIRKPMAENSYLCLGLAGVSLLLAIAGIAVSVAHQGTAPLGAVSTCFSSLLFAAASLVYSRRSFQEEEKNYLLAKIGTGVAGILLILWIVMILIGFHG